MNNASKALSLVPTSVSEALPVLQVYPEDFSFLERLLRMWCIWRHPRYINCLHGKAECETCGRIFKLGVR